MATPDESSPFRCSICFNNKEERQPRFLPCQHSFCEKCLGEWHEKRHREGHCVKTQVECPTCRTKSELQSGDISSLPMDINVQQFAEYITKDTKFISCQLCKSKEGKVVCLMCSAVLCVTCSDTHKKSPLFASHILTESICEHHGAPLQCVCTTCLCGVCLHCVNEDFHKDHLLEEMSVGVKNIKQKIRECSGELEELVRIFNLKVTENRTYIGQFQGVEEIKRTLDMLKKEIGRLEKELADHEKLCKAKIDNVFKEYEAHSKLASAAILNGTELLDKEDNNRALNIIKTVELPNVKTCDQLRVALSSVPEFYSISFTKCRLENVDNALEALINCKLVCGIPDVTAIPVTQASPLQIMKIECGKGCDIKNPWRLYGTPEGDVIVSNWEGGPVYKVNKNGTKTQLLDDGIAACVHGGDVYIFSTGGDTVTQIQQDVSTVEHKLNPPISKPRGLVVSGDNAFILTSKSIFKQSLRDSDSREVLTVKGCKDLRHLLKISDGGMTKLVVTIWDTHEVIICDETGSLLTRFGGPGGEDGLLIWPGGVGRMSNGHLLVADYGNHRIVEYKMDGTFVRNLLTKRDGLNYPKDVVCKYPYLWVVDDQGLKLFRFTE